MSTNTIELNTNTLDITEGGKFLSLEESKMYQDLLKIRYYTSNEKSIEFAKENKKKATMQERAMRKLLTGTNYTFEEQKPVLLPTGGFYILDFYLPEFGIHIEIDGGSHYTVEGRANDANRRKAIASLGFKKEVRFRNKLVMGLTKERLLNIIEQMKISNGLLVEFNKSFEMSSIPKIKSINEISKPVNKPINENNTQNQKKPKRKNVAKKLKRQKEREREAAYEKKFKLKYGIK
jgi:very-short-patch-repair endonuclease